MPAGKTGVSPRDLDSEENQEHNSAYESHIISVYRYVNTLLLNIQYTMIKKQ